MNLSPHSETKKQLSDIIVRHYPFSTSAKASDVLRYFSHSHFHQNLHGPWAEGLIYFSGFSLAFFDHHSKKSHPEPTEVIALCPKWLLSAYRIHDAIYTVKQYRDTYGQYSTVSTPSSFSDYFVHLKTMHGSNDPIDRLNHDSNLAFEGGLAGFIGYDIAAQRHADPKTDQQPHAERLIAALGDYDFFLKKESEGWALYGSNCPTLTPLVQRITEALEVFSRQFAETTILSRATRAFETNIAGLRFNVISPFTPLWSFEQYSTAFTRIQAYLRAGDCYQVNLTQPFVANVNGDLLDVMDDLFELTRAPYSGYMRVGKHELLSCSPELFLAFTGVNEQGNNQVITRPIKGTRPRRDDKEQDTTERETLTHSKKDHSENLMIVDLLRNDLSLYAVVGSVTVPTLFEIESFAQVHHLVSEVRATLRADVSALDVLIDALPGGSITGAPKKRAMEIITELEAAPRGAYCGSFGYLNRDGSGQFNILIRTLQKHEDQLVAWAGGGITIASEVEAEYQECLDKISAILNCVNGFKGEE